MTTTLNAIHEGMKAATSSLSNIPVLFAVAYGTLFLAGLLVTIVAYPFTKDR